MFFLSVCALLIDVPVMAMVMDRQQQQQPPPMTYKHYCKVCKKGFGCGRALGGHMRAHGMNEDPVAAHDDPDVDEPSGCGDGASDWDDKTRSPPAKRMYALRTNPSRLKTCRVCENCGKEFFSWKSFLEHGKCSSVVDDEADAHDDYFASPPRSDDAEEGLVGHAGRAGWSKGKRSRRTRVIDCGSGGYALAPSPNCPSREEEDLANCLVMLSAARVEPMVEVSCASAGKEEAQDHRRQPLFTFAPVVALEEFKAPAPAPSTPRGMFECKACKKVFTSHQALGGHRASHKKVKGCFAAKFAESEEPPPDDDVDARDNASNRTDTASMIATSMPIAPFDSPVPLSIAPLKKRSRVHECSICHRVFSSGQALGGHKRCHWITSNLPDQAFKLLPAPNHANILQHQLTLARSFSSLDPVLDLNFPAAAAAVAADEAVVPEDVGSPLRLDVPPAILLQHLVEPSNKEKSKYVPAGSSKYDNNNDITSNKDKNIDGESNVNNSNENDENNTTNNNMDDEVESKVKIAKLSDLRDINVGGESSPWLQVGIGPSADESNSDP